MFGVGSWEIVVILVVALLATAAPASAKARAMPLPMPLPAPVTMATRFVSPNKDRIITSLLSVQSLVPAALYGSHGIAGMPMLGPSPQRMTLLGGLAYFFPMNACPGCSGGTTL